MIDDKVDDAYGDVDDDSDDDDDDDDVDVDAGVYFHQGHITAHRHHTKHWCLQRLRQLPGCLHFPRGLCFPFPFSFHSLRHFPFRPGVRVELWASQD